MLYAHCYCSYCRYRKYFHENAIFWDMPCGCCKNRCFGEYIASVIRVTRIGEVGTIAVTSNRSMLRRNTMSRATQCSSPEDVIPHSHRHEKLTSYIALTGWALWRRRNVSPVRYKLGFYIPEDCILHSHRHENHKSYKYFHVSIHFLARYFNMYLNNGRRGL
jgi:hypothetical protein